jgi:hypothetical protein
MELAVALSNYSLLRSLTKGMKLRCYDKQHLEVEDRYLSGMRRMITNNSRYELLDPIRTTLELISIHVGFDERNVEELKQIQSHFRDLYPDYSELSNVFEYHLTKLSQSQSSTPIQVTTTTTTTTTASLSKEYIVIDIDQSELDEGAAFDFNPPSSKSTFDIDDVIDKIKGFLSSIYRRCLS